MSMLQKHHRLRVVAFLLFLLSLLYYARTSRFEFVWDDLRSHLTQHEDFMKGDFHALWEKPYDGMYIPLSYTTWYAVKKISSSQSGQLNSAAFHWLNCLFHALNGLLVLLLLYWLTDYLPGALLGSLLFIFHPVQVESVAWVSEFRGLYACFFGLLFLLQVLQLIDKWKGQTRHYLLRSRHFYFSFFFLACSLLSKPIAVVFPPIAILLIYFYRRSEIKKIVYPAILWFLLILPFLILTNAAQPLEAIGSPLTVFAKIQLAAMSGGFYLWKIFFPLNLAACYGLTPQKLVQEGLPYGVLFFGIVGTAIYVYRKNKLYLQTLLLLALVVLPVSGLVSFYYQRFSTVADRYLYIGIIFIALLIAELLKRHQSQKWMRYTIAFFLLLFVLQNNRQLSTWKTEFAMWDQCMQSYPEQWTAAYNRGVLNGKQERYDLAIADYTTALQYKKGDKNTLVNRANAYAERKKFDLAQHDYGEALKADPNDGSIYYDRALTYYYAGDIEAAVRDLKDAIRLKFPVDPEFASTVRAAWIELKKKTR